MDRLVLVQVNDVERSSLEKEEINTNNHCEDCGYNGECILQDNGKAQQCLDLLSVFKITTDSSYCNPELMEKMIEADQRILTCPWCKSQEYTIKKKHPWYRRLRCNSCEKHFVRYDGHKNERTIKAPVSELKQDDIPFTTPYGWKLYEFYAVVKSSGNMHFASASGDDFDEDGFITDFTTVCRSIRTQFDPTWPNKWKLYLMTDENIERKSVCVKCRKLR